MSTVTRPIILGSFSWSAMNGKDKWRLMSAYNTFNIGFGPQLPSEAARDYLKVTQKYPLRAVKQQAMLLHYKRSQPMFCRRCTLPEACYIDLTAAYLSIMDVVGCVPDYYPNRWLGASQPPSDFMLRDNHIARNSLVTSGLPSVLSIWSGKELVNRNTRNELYNMGLWSIVQDVLHGICADFIRYCDLRYWNVDGGIVPATFRDTALEIVRDWGLSARVKAYGRCNIYGLGCYRVGKKRTRTKPSAGYEDISVVNDYVDYQWLKTKMYTLSTRNPLLTNE